VRYGLSAANFGTYSEPARVAELATTAEGAGWEGLFLWDHLAFTWGRPLPTGDPWLLLAAAAHATSKMLLGTHVTAVPRHRVQDLALAVTTLDHLSGGRVVFGAGLGGNEREFAAFGDETDERVRAEQLDEGLVVLRGLWSGERVHRKKHHLKVDVVKLAPAPLQKHLPIWIGGNAPRPLRRAARYDGWAANASYHDHMSLAPADVAARAATIADVRGGLEGFDVVVHGLSDLADPRAYEAAGATWWLENLNDRRAPYADLLARVAQGPPR
jgi:alkanesulfonate monooxygenase SsuD/methylene tetrahydromethanopterin reductase-like flavin-dependent oxidoreductase (luciferase family)